MYKKEISNKSMGCYRSGLGGLGFGEGNLPLDPPVSILENRDLPPIDWTFGLSQNWVGIGQFGWVVGLRSGLDSLRPHTKQISLSLSLSLSQNTKIKIKI